MKLKCDKLISEAELSELSEAFWKEANSLLNDSSHYTAAIYMAGYSLECLLKVAVCRAIQQTALTSIFKTHDLEGLLFYSGLEQKLANASQIESFKKIVSSWNDSQGNVRVRYRSRSGETESEARDFLRWIEEVRLWFLQVS